MKQVVEPIRSKKDIKMVEKYLIERNFRNYVIFVFGINTGLRISDILGLNVSDVFNKTYVEIIEKKTGKHKKFPLNNKLKGILNEYLLNIRSKNYTVEDTEPLFLGKKHKRLNRSQVYRFLNSACKDLKIEITVGTHTMRKTFGYHHYKKFNDVVLLQKILNHSSSSITLRYIGITQEEINVSYNNFEL